jgi:hypothetical protein
MARQDKLDLKLFKNNHLIGFIKLISIINISPQEAHTTAPSGSVYWAAGLKGYTEQPEHATGIRSYHLKGKY